MDLLQCTQCRVSFASNKGSCYSYVLLQQEPDFRVPANLCIEPCADIKIWICIAVIKLCTTHDPHSISTLQSSSSQPSI